MLKEFVLGDTHLHPRPAYPAEMGRIAGPSELAGGLGSDTSCLLNVEEGNTGQHRGVRQTHLKKSVQPSQTVDGGSSRGDREAAELSCQCACLGYGTTLPQFQLWLPY